jgi:hypothetical protein
LTLLSTYIGALFGIMGAATGRVADAVFTFALYRRRMNELTETTYREILAIYVRNLGLTAAAILPSAVLMQAHGWNPHTPLVQVGGAVAVGSVLWAGAAWMLNKRLAEEMAVVVRIVRSGRRRSAAGA